MKIPHIYKSNVAGVNLYGIGISVNQEVKDSESGTITHTPPIFITGMVKGWTLFWLITSSLLSVGSIFFCAACLPRIIYEERPGFDYMGVIVGILALFITFIVAWQISQTMASREEIKAAKYAVGKIKAIEKKVDEIVPMTDAHLQFALAASLRVKGLDIAEVRSDSFEGEEKTRMAHKVLFTCMAFSQYLLALKMYSELKYSPNAKEYIASCLNNIENMATCMRGNYDLVTKGLIHIMISDVESTLIQCGKILSVEQVSNLESLKQELEHNLPNGIDAEAALAEKNKARRERMEDKS